MIEVGAFEAKTHLSALLERVSQGQEVLIRRRGKPVAKLMYRCPFGRPTDRRCGASLPTCAFTAPA